MTSLKEINMLFLYSVFRSKAHDIKYWRLSFSESKKKGAYLPIVRMQVFLTGAECTLPIKFTGCTSDSNLEYHLFLPAGIGSQFYCKLFTITIMHLESRYPQ